MTLDRHKDVIGFSQQLLHTHWDRAEGGFTYFDHFGEFRPLTHQCYGAMKPERNVAASTVIGINTAVVGRASHPPQA